MLTSHRLRRRYSEYFPESREAEVLRMSVVNVDERGAFATVYDPEARKLKQAFGNPEVRQLIKELGELHAVRWRVRNHQDARQDAESAIDAMRDEIARRVAPVLGWPARTCAELKRVGW